jgi:cell fate regulator YaaT (PSP1 superfamily)
MALLAKVYAVEFLPFGKLYYYSYEGPLQRGDRVLGLSFFGLEAGNVVWGPREIDLSQRDIEVKGLLRKFTPEDEIQYEINNNDAQEAFRICKAKVSGLGLPMKLLKAVYMFDRSKLLFYFSAEGRVDFRELVKELAHTFKVRIELRQVGVRDELKFIGALGLCGQIVCCRRFLRDFETVTLKDAKKQQLMINPSKISGQCRRLLCCLQYETGTYDNLMAGIPSQGSIVEFENKVCKVLNSNVFTKIVTVQTDSGQTEMIPFDFFITKKPRILIEGSAADEDNLDILPELEEN